MSTSNRTSSAPSPGSNATASTGIRAWCEDVWSSWERFMFSPADAATLGLIRICTGAMLLYTHFVWTLDLNGFFGKSAWLSKEFVYRYHDSAFGWSHLYWIDSPFLLWTLHLFALIVFACLMVGYQSRIASVLAFLFTVSYAHRASGALFGLDQINGFLSLYLIVGPCGDAFSLDNWFRNKRMLKQGQGGSEIDNRPPPKTSTNIAIRLIQLHLCVVYLFAGFGKLLGESWWQGTALWGAFANQEYQTLDMTWLAHSLMLVNVLTHIALFWEVSYCFLIWNRITRPIFLVLAVPLHLGIAFCMGMVTFGLVMLIANLAFVSPSFVRRIVQRFQPAQAASAVVGTNEADTPSIPKPRHASKRKANRTPQ